MYILAPYPGKQRRRSVKRPGQQDPLAIQQKQRLQSFPSRILYCLVTVPRSTPIRARAGSGKQELKDNKRTAMTKQ